MGTVRVGVCAGGLAGVLPGGFFGDIVSMGTLLAFAVVSIGVRVLRYTRPNVPRPFKVPCAILICPLGFISCLYLFWQPFKEPWHLLVGWVVIGAIVYALYGYRHSKLRSGSAAAVQTRKIGPVLATLVVANNLIGLGFFLLPATLSPSGTLTHSTCIPGT